MNTSGLIKAIHTRRSVRNYLDQPLSKAHLHALLQFVDTLETPFESDVTISLHQGENYMPFKGPGCFAAFRSGAGIVSQAKTGFAGELFILEAERMGIGTCWYGHYNREAVHQAVYGIPQPDADRMIHAITPLGYHPEKPKGLSDRITKIIFGGRNTVDENLHPESIKRFPAYIRSALELACLAPSAMNSQCWQFRVSEGTTGFTVEIGKPAGYRHFKWKYPDIDVGTAACHFWLGILDSDKKADVCVREESGRAVWTLNLPE